MLRGRDGRPLSGYFRSLITDDSVVIKFMLLVLDTALLEWVGEDAVRAYTTPDIAISYLHHTQMA